MDISIICFSLTGFQTALKLQEGLNAQGYHTELYKKSKYLEDSVTESTGNWTAEHHRLQVRNQIRQFLSWMSVDSL